jgi:hypothetical protein
VPPIVSSIILAPETSRRPADLAPQKAAGGAIWQPASFSQLADIFLA